MNNLIDQDVIDSLTEIGDKEFLVELIDIFLSQSKGLIQEIIKAVGECNASDLMKSSHKLKGSCLNLGANDLGNICHQLEAKGKENDFSNIAQIIQPLDSVYQQTCEALIKFK